MLSSQPTGRKVCSRVIPVLFLLRRFSGRPMLTGSPTAADRNRDTIGVATPGQVMALLGALADAGIGAGTLGVHFHDTYGQALANTLAALQSGVSVVDSSAGGLGGCPYAGSATGNLATEDLVWMLDGLGIEHGVDLGSLAATSVWLAGQLGRPSPSRVVAALAG